MKRALLAMTAVLGTAVAVALSCASPLQEIPEQKVEAADLPRTWGDRWYSIRRSGVRMAWLHLKVAEKEGKLAFEDEFALRKNASNEGRLEIRQTVEPNEFLSPISISLSARSSETRDRAFAMEVRDGRIRVLENTFGGDKGEADCPADFTTDPALYRLVTLLPRDAKRTVALLRTPFIAQPQLQARCILSYEEEETLRFEGKRFRTRRFVESDGDTETKRYWVDGAGRLLKVRFSPEVEMVLSDEKTAKDLETATIQREPWPSRVYDPRPLMKALPRKPPENALRFLVFGDSKGSDDFERVVRFADTLKPDFVLTTGDLVHNGGGADGLEDYPKLARQAGWFMERYPVWPIVGNHELGGGDGGLKNFQTFFGLADKYSFTCGNAAFIALPWDFDEGTLPWLEAELGAASGKRIFVFQHRPHYTVGSKGKEEVPGQPTPLTRLFSRHQVTAVFSGHDHIYHRTRRDGVSYVISSGGGAGIYELKRKTEALPDDAYFGKVPGSERSYLFRSAAGRDIALDDLFYFVVLIEIQGPNVTLRMIDWKGKEWDRCALAK